MTQRQLGALFLIVALLLWSDIPTRLDATLAPPSALADGDDKREADDDDRDDDDKGKYARRKGRDVSYRGQSTGEYPGLESGAAVRGGLTITRGPYLQLGTPDNITIRWRTSQPTSSLVRYGTSPHNLELQVAESAATTEHEVRLTGLRPETRYFYSVETSSSVLAGGPSCAFRTAPPPGTERSVRIWIIGDSGLRGRNQQRVQEAYDAYSRGAPTDVWLLLGDNAYTVGSSQQYQAGFFEPYASRLRSTVVWPSRGNHDETRAGPANDYYDFFTLPANGEAGGTPSGTEAYFSFDHANVHFVCLDAERIDNRMVEWLRADLAATDQDWVIAYWHHPPYSKGSHDSDRDGVMTQARKSLLPVLERGGVDLVACGHSHSYERSFLLDGHYGPSSSLASSMVLDRGSGDPNGDGPYHKRTYGRAAPNEGAVYVVVGSSSKLSGGSLDHRAHARSLHSLGSLAVEVSGRRLDAAFVNDQGRVADHFAIVKGEDPLSHGGRNGAPARPSPRAGRGTGR